MLDSPISVLSPDEYPFTPIEQLPPPIINVQEFPSLLHSASTSHPSTNVNSQILRFYIDHIVPKITEGVKVDIKGTGNGVGGDEERDDGNYGSSATRDVEVLQALSRRIHFGKFRSDHRPHLSQFSDSSHLFSGMFVSESKFRQAPHDFIPHITSNPPNREALAGLITKPAVEAALLIRLGNKASLYGAELDPQGNLKREEGGEVKGLGQRIKTDEVVKLYRDWVIPLTKEVEVDYLIHRLEGVDQTQIDEWMKAGERE
jgi:chorismate mutase